MRALQTFEKIYLHKGVVDMRKGINGLLGIVQSSGMGDILGPHLFVFIGRRRDVLKVLYFDHTGFCLWMKRLEQNKFFWIKALEQPEVISVTAEQLEWLLQGYNIWQMKPFEKLPIKALKC